jgi:hypothetical protein
MECYDERKKRWLNARIDELVVPSAPDVDPIALCRFLDASERWWNQSVRYVETYIRIMRHAKPLLNPNIAETGSLSGPGAFLASQGFAAEAA